MTTKIIKHKLKPEPMPELRLPFPEAGTIHIWQYSPDFNDLLDSAKYRIDTLCDQEHPCFYVNPLVTITCLVPTPEFFREVRRSRADWCRRTSFPRSQRRVANTWVGDQWRNKKQGRYIARCLCLTGMVFVNQDHVHSHLWQQYEEPETIANPVDDQANGVQSEVCLSNGGERLPASDTACSESENAFVTKTKLLTLQ